MNDNMDLQEAINLLNMINNDHRHPVNNEMHPKHNQCLLVYRAIENWVKRANYQISSLNTNIKRLYS
jgi:hypothetical protein